MGNPGMSDNPFSEPDDSDRTILRLPVGAASRFPLPVEAPVQQGTYEARVDRLPYYDKPQIPSPPPSSMLRKPPH